MLPDAHKLPTLFGFCAVMCVVVAERRGGQPHTYMQECIDFMRDVIGRGIAARETAEEML